MINYLKKLDWYIAISSLFLGEIGLMCVYSVSLGEGDFLNFKKQAIFLFIGFFLMILLGFFDWRGFRDNPYLILALYLVFILLLAGLLFLAPETRGIKGWYKLGPFSFDPIGLTTIILIILLAKFFSKRHAEMYNVWHIILSGFYVFVPFILITLQPDLGSALILGVIWAGILVVSGIKLKHFAVLIFCSLVILGFSWMFLFKEYQKQRVVGFLSPQTEALSTNWSQNQSKIAIGSGGIWGQGFGKGSQTQNGFLSEPHTDFAFSVIAEEFGLAGISFLVFLFLFLLYRIIKIALMANSNFPRLFAVGLAVFIFSEAFVHIGMNLGVLPVIGLPLPFVSYGGSSLMAIFAGLGILQSIKMN